MIVETGGSAALWEQTCLLGSCGCYQRLQIWQSSPATSLVGQEINISKSTLDITGSQQRVLGVGGEISPTNSCQNSSSSVFDRLEVFQGAACPGRKKCMQNAKEALIDPFFPPFFLVKGNSKITHKPQQSHLFHVTCSVQGKSACKALKLFFFPLPRICQIWKMMKL